MDGDPWDQEGARFWGARNFENNYSLQLGRVRVTIWHFGLWARRLSRLRRTIDIFLS